MKKNSKIAVVTCAATGIDAAIANGLAKTGAQVIAVDATGPLEATTMKAVSEPGMTLLILEDLQKNCKILPGRLSPLATVFCSYPA